MLLAPTSLSTVLTGPNPLLIGYILQWLEVGRSLIGLPCRPAIRQAVSIRPDRPAPSEPSRQLTSTTYGHTSAMVAARARSDHGLSVVSFCLENLSDIYLIFSTINIVSLTSPQKWEGTLVIGISRNDISQCLYRQVNENPDFYFD